MPKAILLQDSEQTALRELLKSVLAGRNDGGHHESLGQFGSVLAATIDPKHRPFSKQYVIRLREADDRITPEIARALNVLGAMLDGQSEVQARAREYTVLATHELPGNTVVLVPARQCALPGCRVAFVGYPAQRYCGPECRKEAQRRRREASHSAVH
jgi:hypothetical protein